MIDDPTKPTVEYWVRKSDTPPVFERQREVYRRLKRYEERGRIRSVDVNHWTEYIRCPGQLDDGTAELCSDGDWATYRAFSDWATENGYDLGPAFRRCEHTSVLGPDRLDVIRLPLLCLAVYADECLQAVFPCSTDDRVWTVRDGLAILDSSAVSPHLRERRDVQEVDGTLNRSD